VELLRRQRHRLTAPQHGAGGGDDFHRAELLGLPGAVSRRSRAAQQRLHTRQELEHAERLRDVVVRAQPQAANLVGFLAARREDEDGHPAPLIAQRAEHAVAVQAGQHQIENDQVARGVTGPAEPRSRSRRQNWSQMRSRSAAGTPGPWSSTQMRARPSPTERPRVTVWPAGPYFTALSSRLRSI